MMSEVERVRALIESAKRQTALAFNILAVIEFAFPSGTTREEAAEAVRIVGRWLDAAERRGG